MSLMSQHEASVKAGDVTSSSTSTTTTTTNNNTNIQIENMLPIMEDQLQIANPENPVPGSDFLRFPFINQEFFNEIDTSEFLKSYLGEDTTIVYNDTDSQTSQGLKHTQKEGSVINFFSKI